MHRHLRRYDAVRLGFGGRRSAIRVASNQGSHLDKAQKSKGNSMRQWLRNIMLSVALSLIILSILKAVAIWADQWS